MGVILKISGPYGLPSYSRAGKHCSLHPSFTNLAEFPAMTRTFILVFLVGLAGCSTPSPRFIGSDRMEVSVGAARFAVYQRADEVEVLRISRTFLPKESAVILGAIQAIEQATGCPVRPRSVKGDQAIITAKIDCGT
jgi:hypothetical protein